MCAAGTPPGARQCRGALRPATARGENRRTPPGVQVLRTAVHTAAGVVPTTMGTPALVRKVFPSFRGRRIGPPGSDRITPKGV